MQDKDFRIFSIEPTIRRFYLPYPKEEKRKLMAEILSNGYDKPFLTYSGVLVTDFDAYEICFDNNIPFYEKRIGFPCKEIAYSEICKMQLREHPFLTETMRKYLIGKVFLLDKALGKRQAKKKKEKEKNPPKRPYKPKYSYEESAIKMREMMGKEYNVSGQTIYKYSVFAEALEKTAGADDEFYYGVLTEKIRISIDTLLLIAQKPPRERREAVLALWGCHDTYSSSRKGLNELNGQKEDTALDIPVITEIKPRVGAIKNMPKYDPDSELNTLFYTVPSWSESLQRVRENTDINAVSESAKQQSRKVLVYLLMIISHFLNEIEEDKNE